MKILWPDCPTKFSDYVKQMFTPYIISQLQHVSRLHVVWDQYFPESLKAETCSKGGNGVGRPVEPQMPFLETGRSSFVLMTARLSYFPSGKLSCILWHWQANDQHSSCWSPALNLRNIRFCTMYTNEADTHVLWGWHRILHLKMLWRKEHTRYQYAQYT